jgi:hypothetical protein
VNHVQRKHLQAKFNDVVQRLKKVRGWTGYSLYTPPGPVEPAKLKQLQKQVRALEDQYHKAKERAHAKERAALEKLTAPLREAFIFETDGKKLLKMVETFARRVDGKNA